jgi:hypothetical protein
MAASIRSTSSRLPTSARKKRTSAPDCSSSLLDQAALLFVQAVDNAVERRLDFREVHFGLSQLHLRLGLGKLGFGQRHFAIRHDVVRK